MIKHAQGEMDIYSAPKPYTPNENQLDTSPISSMEGLDLRQLESTPVPLQEPERHSGSSHDEEEVDDDSLYLYDKKNESSGTSSDDEIMVKALSKTSIQHLG
jgi:hypothetical protein